MKLLFLYLKSSLFIILTFASLLTHAQCEGLKGNNEDMNNWKDKYYSYFNEDSATELIKADSILIYYFSNPDNETNQGMSCCYYLADKHAKRELAEYLDILENKLEKEDSEKFKIAQQAWQNFYDTEWEFLRQAFVSYANFSKYGQGREIMIQNQARKYQMIKDRILAIKKYIETASTEVFE